MGQKTDAFMLVFEHSSTTSEGLLPQLQEACQNVGTAFDVFQKAELEFNQYVGSIVKKYGDPGFKAELARDRKYPQLFKVMQDAATTNRQARAERDRIKTELRQVNDELKQALNKFKSYIKGKERNPFQKKTSLSSAKKVIEAATELVNAHDAALA